MGSVPITPQSMLKMAMACISGEPSDSAEWRIITVIRLPRLLAALAAGTMLAWCGLVFQTLLRNPLASPSVVGVSNGAALGAVVGLLLAGNALWMQSWLVPSFSLAGGTAAMLLVVLLERRSLHSQALLLNGLSIGLLCSALSTGLLFFAHERLESVVFWLMGGLGQAGWPTALILSLAALALGVLLLALAPALNVLALGEQAARDLGLEAGRLQRLLFFAVSVAIAVCVSLVGPIGFIGLVVPHLLRLLVGSDHRRLLWLTGLGGAVLLSVADLLGRTVVAPSEIPAGVFTALIGTPVFVWLLQRRTTPGDWR